MLRTLAMTGHGSITRPPLAAEAGFPRDVIARLPKAAEAIWCRPRWVKNPEVHGLGSRGAKRELFERSSIGAL